MGPLATQFTRSVVLLAVLVAGQPVAAQTLPPSDASVPSTPSHPRVVVHVYVEPSLNRMTEWHARMDALQADASARGLPISDMVTNGFVAWGGTLLVRLTPRILVGGELGKVHDQDRFAVTEPVGGIFPGSAEFGVGVETTDRNAQFVLAFYPREESNWHVQLGAGLGQSHVVFASRRTQEDGEGTGPILSALFGTEWKIFYLTAGARFHRMPINYTRLDELGIRNNREFPDDPSVDLTGVFVRVGLAFHWLRD
jgi:hypothetical protein